MVLGAGGSAVDVAVGLLASIRSKRIAKHRSSRKMGREFDSDDLEPGRVNVADVAVAGSREETTLIFGKYSKTPLLLLFLLQLLLLCLLPPPMRTYIFQHTKYIYRVSIEPRDPPLLLL